MDILTLKNGETRLCASDRDFSELIAEYMGVDSQNFFDDLMRDFDCLYAEVEEYRKLLGKNI